MMMAKTKYLPFGYKILSLLFALIFREHGQLSSPKLIVFRMRAHGTGTPANLRLTSCPLATH